MSLTTSVLVRYCILVAVSCMYLGVYWIYDLPSALSTQLQFYLTLSSPQYTYLLSSLYIAFAVPSIGLPFFSGWAIQRYGARPLLYCCLAAVFGSQLGFCVGVQTKSTAGLVVARAFLGMGGEVLGVLGTEIVTRWFPGDKTGLAMAIYESISSLGSVANSNLTPRLTETYGTLTATWFSSTLALGLVALSALYVVAVDVNEDSAEKEGKKKIRPVYPSTSTKLLRFIASRFYADNQTAAGLAVSIVHFVGGVMPMFLGMLLEIPVLRNYSLALLYSQILMLVAHTLFLADYGEPILPLSLIAIGNALFSAGIWASVSVSIMQDEDSAEMPLELESTENAPEVELEEERNFDSDRLLSIPPAVEDKVHGDDLIMIGYGIITSLMGISIVVTPFFLTAAERWAGYNGLEIVFVTLASIGVLTCLGGSRLNLFIRARFFSSLNNPVIFGRNSYCNATQLQTTVRPHHVIAVPSYPVLRYPAYSHPLQENREVQTYPKHSFGIWASSVKGGVSEWHQRHRPVFSSEQLRNLSKRIKRAHSTGAIGVLRACVTPYQHMQAARTKTEALSQKAKLVNSYNELLQEFSSPDLRVVGNYTLGRLIGKGSFGKVYLATHKLTNNSKVVLKSSNKQDSTLAREIHHHRQFLHPHIARLYEVIVTENLVWLVLEYCPGDELYNHLLNNGPLPVDKVRRIFAQLVGAVAYVHSKSCVHRDLKLENILLDKHGNVKLCDFGFTREYEGKASYLQTFCGTICYSAPEMLKGEKYAGEKVDVWSLGIILYALLAGELPYDEDDDQETKAKILKEDPLFNDKFPEDSQSLIKILLSKRPLLRPTLTDILSHPFLAEHGVEQQIILQTTRPSPFTTALEKTTLLRMKSAGVNIDQVIEHVLSQRCDALAGWWALLIEKEERKEKKRERKRKEKEAEARSLRRLSAASSRLEKISALVEVDEEDGDTLQARGRRDRRSLPTRLTFHFSQADLSIPEVPKLPEGFANLPPLDVGLPPQPIDKDSVRSLSSTRRRPIPPPKEHRHSRPSMLHVSASQPELASHSSGIFKRRTGRRHQHSLMSQLASLKHWIVESAKRAKSPHPRTPKSTGGQSSKRSEKSSPGKGSDIQRKQVARLSANVETPVMTPTQIKRSSNASSLAPNSASYAHHRNSYGRQARASSNRNSLSPAPLTPRGSYRRSSAGLRGRKSTSSSISSVRSIHHVHSHSKASSISSNSVDTMSTPTASTRMSRSPHTSVKVLPATPTTGSRFPSNIRLVRNPPNALRDANDPENHGIYSVFNETLPAQSQGFIFARRKRTPFRGPMLNTNNVIFSNGPGTPNLSPPLQKGGASSEIVKPITRKSQIIEEEDAVVEEDEEDIEEVDTFSDPGITDTSLDVVAEPPAESEEATQSETIISSNKGDEEREDSAEIHGRPTLEPAVDLPLPSDDLLLPRSSSLHDPEAQQQSLPDLAEDLEPDAVAEQETPIFESERQTEADPKPATGNESVVEDTNQTTEDVDSSSQQPTASELETDMTKEDTAATATTTTPPLT
ncbi:hypothetical protein UA08_02832 [Talaromyces atroroseus]|uniref:Protein kinase domain-containing protein n=1 Tax=Talaromyces atroroseus TaxID=1441469 RepID=A0A225ALW6_TALAT|nr:hypothetical protein UA08_02832 [Talaromyces atroroseus]OKL61890.1 hypothetical protein UA08_02832 [Talaromyces atroroseus]